MAETDPDTEIALDCSPMFRQYKSGRVERLMGTYTVPAGLDATTNVTTKDVTIDPATGLSARLYLPKLSSPSEKLPILIYIHGGGFCTGSAFNPNPFLTLLISKIHFLGISIDYRLAPEHKLPVAYDDCWQALQWAITDASVTEHADISRVFLFGESAGANIAHNIAMHDGAEIEGMLLGHPYFWGSDPIGSETTESTIRGNIEGLWRVVNEEGVGVDDLWFNPMAEGGKGLEGLGCRKVMVCVAEKDVLAERGRAYCEALKGSGWGGEVELVESEGEDHVFFYMKHDCERALELLERMVAFFNKPTIRSKKARPAKLSSKFNTTSQLPSRIQNFGNKDASGIRMQLKLPKSRSSIFPKISISYNLQSRACNGEIFHKVVNFGSLAKSANNFHMIRI